jgi:hypothetical protein
MTSSWFSFIQHILCSATFFFRKLCRLCDNVEKYCTARQATDGNIICSMSFEFRINMATDTHSEYAILIAFPLQQW